MEKLKPHLTAKIEQALKQAHQCADEAIEILFKSRDVKGKLLFAEALRRLDQPSLQGLDKLTQEDWPKDDNGLHPRSIQDGAD